MAVGIFFLPIPALWGAAEGDFLSLQNRVIELFKEQSQAIVRVKAAYRPQREEEKPQVIIGSGFFTSRDGHVLTNASIAYKPDRVWVEHCGIDYAAEVIGADPVTNLSLLRVLNLPEQFHFLHLSDNPGLPPIGSLVVRISTPLEFGPSPCLGLVAGQETRVAESYFPCTYIRTTIPASPGDGGAAFLDLNGELVGLQVYSIPDLQGTYLLPARAALRIRDDLYFSGRVSYGWIGFEIAEENSIKNGNQIVLRKVFPGTPAEEAGLRPNDLLLEIGGYPIRSVSDLRNAMFYMRVGQFARTRIMRDEEELVFNVRMAPRPEPAEATGQETNLLAGNPAVPGGTNDAMRETVPESKKLAFDNEDNPGDLAASVSSRPEVIQPHFPVRLPPSWPEEPAANMDTPEAKAPEDHAPPGEEAEAPIPVE